jgi:hypothetical protein
MPGGKTHFNPDWLKQDDGKGHKISDWCEASSESVYKAHCFLCDKHFFCDNQGAPQLKQHAKGDGHMNLAKQILDGSQTVLHNAPAATSHSDTIAGSSFPAATPSKQSATCSKQLTLECISSRDVVTKAELIWSMKVVSSHFSYASCDDLKETLHAMFPGRIPDNFSLSSSKVSYLISDATGPHFHELLLRDVKESDLPYTIQYDETTNAQTQKQLDIAIRFWSAKRECVMVHHLQTFLMGHATGKQLSEKILEAIHGNNLRLELLLMLESDGPNVNKTVWNNINETVKSLGRKSLVDIGTCNLHICHNAFSKGLAAAFGTLPDLVIDLYQWFKLSAARQEDYRKIQNELGLPKHKFLKHVECRWLTLAPAISRVLEQWDSLLKYFLTDLAKEKDITKNSRYRRICNILNAKETHIQLHFVFSIADLFSSFLQFFQRKEPLIHVLYDQLCLLVKQLLNRFVKSETIDGKSMKDLAAMDFKAIKIQKDDKAIDIGDDARKRLQKLTSEKTKLFFLDCRHFLAAASMHLLQKIPFSNSVLKNARLLQPLRQKESWTEEALSSLSKKLPLKTNTDRLKDEWRLYQSEDISRNWFEETSDDGKKQLKRIDLYWNKIDNIKTSLGEPKYPTLMPVIKSLLVLAHGNADVERGFSDSGKNVTSERTALSEQSINGLRSTSDGIKLFGNIPHAVPISKSFLQKAKGAHASYRQRLEEEKKKKEKEQEKQKEKQEEKERNVEMKKMKEDLFQKEKRLDEKESNQQAELDVANSLFKEANAKLKKALHNKDFKDASLAQAMLDAAQTKLDSASKAMETVRGKKRTLDKQKKTMIDHFLSAPKKKK